MRLDTPFPLPAAESASETEQVTHKLWVGLKACAIPLSLMALALFLRIYRLEELGWVPDTYERLFDAQRLASGELPASDIYPPGASVVMAPFFLIFSDSLATMQAVIIASSVALVGISYAWMLRVTGDRRAAVLIGVVAAALPIFISFSRDALFDMINLPLIAGLLFLAPLMRNRSLLAFAGYGALLALLVNIRPTSGVLIPALLMLWLNAQGTGLNRRELFGALFSPPLLVTAASFAGLCLASVLFGSWFDGAGNAPLNLDGFVWNAASYYYGTTYGIFAVFVVPLALMGLAHLWRSNHIYTWVFAYIIVIWPLVHAPFDFATNRYMLPVLLVVFFLVAIGASSLLKGVGTARNPGRLKTAFAIWGLSMLAVQFAVGSSFLLAEWHNRTTLNDAGLAREFSPAVKEMEADSLVVTAVARAFWDTNSSISYVDLIDHHLAWGTDDDSLFLLTSAIEGKLAEGDRVYYLFSHWEAGHDFLGYDGKQNYDRFYDAINSQFSLTQIQHSIGLRVGLNPWILYEVGTRHSIAHSP